MGVLGRLCFSGLERRSFFVTGVLRDCNGDFSLRFVERFSVDDTEYDVRRILSFQLLPAGFSSLLCASSRSSLELT